MTDDLPQFADQHDVRIASREGFWLVGLVSTGSFRDANARIGALWEELVARRAELKLPRDPGEWLSLCHGRETEFTCYLGLALPEEPPSVPRGMVAIEVPPHEYGVASVRGTQADVNAVYTQLPAWIEAQDREWNRSILWIESYPEPYRDGETELHFDIWLPLLDA